MAVIAREATITYGAYAVGGADTSRILRDFMVSEEGYELFSIRYTFTIQKDTTAAFATACKDAEDAFRIPHQALTIVGLGNRDYLPTDRTGFNAVPSIEKFGHSSDSGLSRTYRARIEMGRPADNSSSNGRRITRTGINVEYGPQRRRTVTITGEWTGITTTTARAQYEAQITSYAVTILTGLGGTYKILHEPQTTNDDANNIIQIAISYEEILNFDVGGSDSTIRSESIIVSRRKEQPGDTPAPGFISRVTILNCSYTAFIEKSVTDIRSKWGTLKSRIISLVQTTFGAGAITVISEEPNFDYTDNKVTATMTFLGMPNGDVIESRATTQHETTYGIALVPIWSGDEWERYMYQGPSSEIRTETIVQRVRGWGFELEKRPLLFPQPNGTADRGIFVTRKEVRSAVPLILGGVDGSPVLHHVTDITYVRVFERANIRRKAPDVITPNQHTPSGTPTPGTGVPVPGVDAGGSSNSGASGSGAPT